MGATGKGTESNPLSWTMTQEQKDHYNTLDFNAGIAYLHELELANGSRVRDEMNPSVLHERTFVAEPVTQAPAQPTIKIGDMSFTGTEQEIELQLKAYFESQQRQPAAVDPPPARDPNTGRFARQDAQPSTTSAVDKVLNDQVAKAIEEKTGVSLEEVKQLVEERRGKLETQSWAEATEAFKNGPGSSWPGGEVNQKKLAETMRDTNVNGVPLMDLPDKVQAMKLAYDYMVQNDLLVTPPEQVERQRKADADAKAAADLDEWKKAVAKATTREEIDELTGRTARAQAALRPGSGQFGTK